jgi:hypothetical protein
MSITRIDTCGDAGTRMIKVQSTGPVILGTIGHKDDDLQGLPSCILCNAQGLTMHQHPWSPITTVVNSQTSGELTIYQTDMFTVVVVLAAPGNWVDLYVDAGGQWQVIRKG